MAKDKDSETQTETSMVPALSEHDAAMLNALKTFSATHQGKTLTYENMTPASVAYHLDMGHKQSLGDIATTSGPVITGFKKNGSPHSNPWDLAKRQKEAKRLGFVAYGDTESERVSLADSWIADSINEKFASILAGELTVNESGTRGNKIETAVRAKVKAIITAQDKKAQDALPKAERRGRVLNDAEMKALVDLYYEKRAEAVEQIRVLETQLAAFTAT